MSKITNTKRNRAIVRDGKIVGYLEPQPRKAFFEPKSKSQRFVLLSVGQLFNWSKAFSRKNIIYRDNE